MHKVGTHPSKEVLMSEVRHPKLRDGGTPKAKVLESWVDLILETWFLRPGLQHTADQSTRINPRLVEEVRLEGGMFS